MAGAPSGPRSASGAICVAGVDGGTKTEAAKNGLSVVIPVGPEAHHAQYLDECLRSVARQSRPPDEVLIVDDMHGIDSVQLRKRVPELGHIVLWSEHPRWRLGVAHAFNVGVAAAKYDLVMMLGADDKLLPDCLHEIWRVYEKLHRQDAYYWVGVEYSDDREEKHQFAPCGAAAVTKGLWRFSGGFPTQASSGASDSALVSILWKHHPELLVGVAVDRVPLYWYRVHGDSDTSRLGPWQDVILQTRNLVTAEWEEPAWGRYHL